MHSFSGEFQNHMHSRNQNYVDDDNLQSINIAMSFSYVNKTGSLVDMRS